MRVAMIAAMIAAASASAAPATIAESAAQRTSMVTRIRNEVRAADPMAADAHLENALQAIASIPREEFVSNDQRAEAYEARSLPIGYDQTISDAYIVAVMTAALRLPPHARVLDVGTGSGYQAAVLAKIADHVSSIEIIEPLAAAAKARLARLGYGNVDVRAGDGYAGWPDHAPFDGIVVAAGTHHVPQPLIDQLKIGGRLVMPIGANWAFEQIVVVTRTGKTTTTRCSLGWSMFVPLSGSGARRADAAGLFDRDLTLCFEKPVARTDFVAAAK